MKRDFIKGDNIEHLQLVDPFVRPIADCLQSKHAKVNYTFLGRTYHYLYRFNSLMIVIGPQTKFAKVMFLHVSVCSTGGNTPPQQVHPWAGTPPQQVHPPAGTLPQQAHLPGRYPRAGTPPREQCMLGDTGNKRAVRIPLECILISNESVVSIQVTSTALRCCLWILRFPLPSLKTNIKSITNSLFVLLNNYASPGAANEGTDNFELIVTCFKVQFMENFHVSCWL